MNGVLPLEWGLILLVAAVAAASGLYLHGLLLSRHVPARGNQDPVRPGADQSSFLLDGNEIIGQDLGALPPDDPIRSALFWEDLHDHLSERFQGFPSRPEDLPEDERSWCMSDNQTLEIVRKGSRTRLILSQKPAQTEPETSEPQGDAQLIAALDSAPYPIWRTDHDGTLLWQNDACTALLQDAGARAQMMTPLDATPDGSDTRICINMPDSDASKWYDITHVQAGDDMFHFARDVTQVIQAGTVQRDFVQTLTKTFSNLTTGLAVFDRSHRLALFNPALVDLTQAQVAFLSARPDMMDFFDHLREAQIMPEPKNYADWRTQMRDAVNEANAGLYQEMWSLPDGLTYRVTGRPHPDGAIAFLFEDISAEISLTRRFRKEIELRQSVLDNLEDAVAVFAPDNMLMFCNEPCSELIKINPEDGFADLSLRDFLAATRDALGEGVALDALAKSLLYRESRISETILFPIRKGRRASCHIHPLAGGARLLVISVIRETTANRQHVLAS